MPVPGASAVKMQAGIVPGRRWRRVGRQRWSRFDGGPDAKTPVVLIVVALPLLWFAAPVVVRDQRFLLVLLGGDVGLLRAGGGDRQRFGFRDLRHVFRVAETLRRIGLRIGGERPPLSADQAGVLGLVPALAAQMHAGTAARFPGAQAAAVAFHDCQIESRQRRLRQRQAGARGGVAALRQFVADVADHAFDRLGRDRLAGDFGHHDPSLAERPRLGGGDHDPRGQQRRQLAGVKPQGLPMRGKNPDGRSGSGL